MLEAVLVVEVEDDLLSQHTFDHMRARRGPLRRGHDAALAQHKSEEVRCKQVPTVDSVNHFIHLLLLFLDQIGFGLVRMRG